MVILQLRHIPRAGGILCGDEYIYPYTRHITIGDFLRVPN